MVCFFGTLISAEWIITHLISFKIIYTYTYIYEIYWNLVYIWYNINILYIYAYITWFRWVLSRSLPPFSLPGLSPFSLSGHSGAVCCVSADFQRKWAVSGSDDGTLRLWCLGEGPEEGRLNIYDYCGDYCSLIIRIILGFIPLSWKCPLLICWLVRSFGIHKGPTSPSMFDRWIPRGEVVVDNHGKTPFITGRTTNYYV